MKLLKWLNISGIRLSPRRKAEIERKANRLLEFCGCLDHPPPIDLNRPLLYLRLQVKNTDLPCSLLERGIARGGEPTIHIPAPCYCGVGRRRFSTAHEIGHHILGHRIDSLKNDREANWFAACLLMPRSMFTFAWEDFAKYGRQRLQHLAGLFQASFRSVDIRARELGLTKNVDRWGYFF